MIHRTRMSRFFLASLCLHACGALSLTSALQLTGQRETVLTVTMDETGRAFSNKTPSHRPGISTIREQQEPRATQLSSNTTLAETTPTHPSTAAPSPQVPSDGNDRSDTQHAFARARIEAQLLADLHRYFEYPLLARRQGWQGTVWLSVVVEADGTLDRVRVTRGSGHDVLDNSAMNALHKVEKLVEASRWLSGHALEMDIPVVYRLRKN